MPSGFSNLGGNISKNGSNLDIAIAVHSAYSYSNSHPISDSDLDIANQIVADIKSNLTSDQLLEARRGLAISQLVFQGMFLD